MAGHHPWRGINHKRDDQDEPKQTTPKGAEIPIPTRDAFLRDLAKAAPKVDSPAKSRAKPDASEGS